MTSKYTDIPSCMQCIGAIYNNPSLLDENNYHFNEEDFSEEFHKILFGTIFNLHALGAQKINTTTIENYLEQRTKKLAVYKANKGDEYLEKLSATTQIAAFDYYYSRVKKMTLLREYDKHGVDVSWLYDPDNIFDSKKKQSQEDWLDNTPIEDIADKIDERISNIRMNFVDNAEDDFSLACEGGDELLNELQNKPDVGYPLYGPLINTIWRGARLTKFYLRSAPTNVGKSRAMVADACNIACDEIYDIKEKKWVKNGTCEPTAYVMTEQMKDEVQTMIWAFLSGVNEEHILTNTYYDDEFERVQYAKNLLKRCPLYLKEMHDFSLSDIENTVKIAVRKYEVRYFFLDYIHSSMKILSEVSGKAKVAGLREDNVLFMIGVRLKDLATQYGIFILSSTQLNGDYVDSKTPDQNLLRGAKSLGDKVDGGSIMLLLTEDDKKAIQPICTKKGCAMPNLKISIYKNRRGRYNHLYLWCNADLGTCRIEPIFATHYDYTYIEMEDFKIHVKPRTEDLISAF